MTIEGESTSLSAHLCQAVEEVTFANLQIYPVLHSRQFPQLNLLSELGPFKGDDWLNRGLNASPLNLRGAAATTVGLGFLESPP